MRDIVIEKAAVKIAALDVELRAALGTAISGITVSDNVVIVHLLDGGEPTANTALARSIVSAHDAATAVEPVKPPTLEEKLETLQTRIAALESKGEQSLGT